MTRRLSPEALREAAEVAAATGVSIVIEDRGRVYRIDPHGQSFPVTANEKDKAECDAAFGLSG
jgi:hypothetical protein